MDLTIRASRMTVGALFRQRAALQPQAVALSDGAHTLTYGALGDRVARVAAGLQALGLKRHDRIAV